MTTVTNNIAGSIIATTLTASSTPVTVGSGGLGVASPSAGYVLLGNGTGAVQQIAPSTSGNVLTSNATTWSSQAPGAGASTFTTLRNSAGSSTTTTANDLDSFTVSGLSASNILWIIVQCIGNGNNTGTYLIQGNGVSLQAQASDSGAAPARTRTELFVFPHPSTAGSVMGNSTNINAGGNILSYECTAAASITWTSSWTLSLRSTGVTSGGTLSWNWRVYKM